MKLIITLFGILLVLSGVLLMISPEVLFSFIEENLENLSLYITAIVIRIVLGILLIKSAVVSKFPTAIKFLGFFFIIAALAFIFIGHENFQDLIVWVVLEFKPYGRLAGLGSMAFGGFLIYAFSDRKKLNAN